MKKPKSIEARSLVSGRNLEPYIQVVMMYDDDTEELVTQWTPAEAYHHAMNVLACIEGANTDAFLISFLTAHVGWPLDQTGIILRHFREWRKQRLTPEKNNEV